MLPNSDQTLSLPVFQMKEKLQKLPIEIRLTGDDFSPEIKCQEVKAKKRDRKARDKLIFSISLDEDDEVIGREALTRKESSSTPQPTFY